jgi:uncharacterized protein YbjT (DUF2867 family)
MKVVLFGSTGMVGQGVLRECLLAKDVELVLAVVRRPTGRKDAKLREVVQADFLDLKAIEPALTGFDACFFCLGVTSAGRSEAEYTRLTYDMALAAARPLSRLNPGMAFVYVSGAGTDQTEKGRVMWARVKGRTENALMALPLKTYLFRPGAIEARHGEVSGTRSYRILYRLLGPLLPVLRALFPGSVTTTDRIGRAMLQVARLGAPKPVLESRDIDAAAGDDGR